MCLILIAHRASKDLPLLVLANRDEYFDRPTARAARWKECPELIAGRDLVSGGSWFGVRGAKWSCVTNVREGFDNGHPTRSRGWLVRDYLLADCHPHIFLNETASQRMQYAGYNLLLGYHDELWYSSNRGAIHQKLAPGIYGLSNHLLDTPWPKVVRGKDALHRLLMKSPLETDCAFALLADQTIAADDNLPKTGIPLQWERALSAAFIKIENYGTRCSTVLSKAADGAYHFFERSFSQGSPEAWEETTFQWKSEK